MIESKSEFVKVHIEDRVLQVTLDRPKANAIDAPVSRAIGEIMLAFRDDPELRVAIITGGGDKFFCAGWDLKTAVDEIIEDPDYGVGGFGGIQDLRAMNKPIIAAINGICCGGGFEFALDADILIAAETATFAFPEIRVGTYAPAACIALPKRIPYHIAMEMLLTGRWFDAAEAHRWGLVNHVVPKDKVMDKAWEIARLLAKGPPLVFAATKDIVRDAENKKFQEALAQRYDAEPVLRARMDDYVNEFERLLDGLATGTDSDAQMETALASDAGKLFMLLAQASGRMVSTAGRA